MTNQKKEHVALFRFGVIFPLLNEGLSPGERTRIIEEICAKSHKIPFSTRTKITRSTVYLWYSTYLKRRNIEDLQPKERNDSGIARAMTDEQAAELRKLRSSNPEIKLSTLVEIARDNGVFAPGEVIPMSAVYRMFSEWKHSTDYDKEMLRFEMESCNDCWMLDAMHGPKVLVGEGLNRKTATAKCFAFIDDKSRLIAHAQFYADETADSLLDCMWTAFNKRGLPRKVFTDNGQAMRDTRLALGLADLEVQLSFSQPYKPQGKAKIERFWRTLRMQFLPRIPSEPITLYELNKFLDAYIEEYNNRYHSGIGMSPMERYMGDIKAVRPAPQNLPSHFRTRVERTVSKCRTVSIDGVLFEVPMGYAGYKIELRYFSLDGIIEAYMDGKKIGVAERVNLVANSNAHRKGGDEK